MLSLTGKYPLIPRGEIYHTPRSVSRKFWRAGENSCKPLQENELKNIDSRFALDAEKRPAIRRAAAREKP